MVTTRISGRTLGVVAALSLLSVLLVPAPAQAQADLTVRLVGPTSARPGSQVEVTLTVTNRGNVPAPGTASRGRDGYMVDLFLTRGAIPPGFATFSASYRDGVLLRGGRVGNTGDLSPGKRAEFHATGGIPSDTPPGSYRLCAKVDPGAKVVERSESNNVRCQALQVGNAALEQVHPAMKDLSPFFGRRLAQPRILGSDQSRALPHAIQPPRPTGGGEVTRSVLADGTIELRYPDGHVQRLRPDGKVETVTPDGTVMVPYAIQVQVADLPPLPPGLSPWGHALGDRLVAILRNILTDDEFAAYRKTEAGKDYYDLVDWRLRSIAFLTSAE